MKRPRWSLGVSARWVISDRCSAVTAGECHGGILTPFSFNFVLTIPVTGLAVAVRANGEADSCCAHGVCLISQNRPSEGFEIVSGQYGRHARATRADCNLAHRRGLRRRLSLPVAICQCWSLQIANCNSRAPTMLFSLLGKCGRDRPRCGEGYCPLATRRVRWIFVSAAAEAAEERWHLRRSLARR